MKEQNEKKPLIFCSVSEIDTRVSLIGIKCKSVLAVGL